MFVGLKKMKSNLGILSEIFVQLCSAVWCPIGFYATRGKLRREVTPHNFSSGVTLHLGRYVGSAAFDCMLFQEMNLFPY